MLMAAAGSACARRSGANSSRALFKRRTSCSTRCSSMRASNISQVLYIRACNNLKPLLSTLVLLFPVLVLLLQVAPLNLYLCIFVVPAERGSGSGSTSTLFAPEPIRSEAELTRASKQLALIARLVSTLLATRTQYAVELPISRLLALPMRVLALPLASPPPLASYSGADRHAEASATASNTTSSAPVRCQKCFLSEWFQALCYAFSYV